MSTAAIVLLGLSTGTYLLKAAGPLLFGGRRLPAALDGVAQIVPAALLAALIVVSTNVGDRALEVDARMLGVAAAGIALWRKAPFFVVVILAVVVTGVTRAVT